MIVPQYWAEGRAQFRERGRQITAHRFGWSDVSQVDAQSRADSRAQAALARLVAGDKLVKREQKVPYNGAEGVPIREEIVGRHGDTIVTRNAYGARCLNSPDVLFVDIDFQYTHTISTTLSVFAVLLSAAVALAWVFESRWYGIAIGIVAFLASSAIASTLHRLTLYVRGGAEHIARNRVAAFMTRHPDWHLRLYRTPAGLRVLAMHRTFNPNEPAVAACFRALGADPVYARMCLRQCCFRARVSPKPWRIGIARHIRPRPGVWPVKLEQMPLRDVWIETYERAAHGHASCRFIEAVGSKVEHPAARAVKELHDELCKAASALPIA